MTQSTVMKLAEKYTDWAKVLVHKRKEKLRDFRAGNLQFKSTKLDFDFKIDLPVWCQDQRNQMTGPADDVELVVKMINSGAPGVMLDLEDSMANERATVRKGLSNSIRSLEGRAYFIDKQNKQVNQKKNPLIFVRPRGLHLFDSDSGGEISSAFYDTVQVADNVDLNKINQPVCFYIPKSESAEEALWWRELFRDLADARGQPSNWIKCMALVESFPMAFEMDEFIFNLREHLLGLNLGRWDYMASVIQWHLNWHEWVFPDRNLIDHDVQFFQNLRYQLVNTCHERGILAIGGMTAVFPNRNNKNFNDFALNKLREDKQNEAACGFDGAWTGHPDQNDIAINSFPLPNQLNVVHKQKNYLENVPSPFAEDKTTTLGLLDAIETCIIYKYYTLKGKGASLINGYMEDLATFRIYKLLITQRLKHGYYTPLHICKFFDESKEQFIINNENQLSVEDLILLNEATLETLKEILKEA